MAQDNKSKDSKKEGEEDVVVVGAAKPEPNADKLAELFKMLAAEPPGANVVERRRKDMSNYRFWQTQPVAKFDEEIKEQGPIETKTVDQVPTEPYPLLKEFEWSVLDLSDSNQVKELYELLDLNYVEDVDSSMRFNYSPRFLDWALKAPGWNANWHLGVRVAANKRLVAFISAIPVTILVRGKPIKSVEINFLCIHKKLRSKRLAPILIREITRRVNLQDIWQALYTAGAVLPKPVSTCQYYHRPLNWNKLYNVGFSPIPPGMTRSKMIARYALPQKTKVKHLRLMTDRDVTQVLELLSRYLEKFDIQTAFSAKDIKHWFLHDEGINDKERVVWAYVATETDKPDSPITDFMSFYRLSSNMLKQTNNNNESSSKEFDKVNAAYSFYYATRTALHLKRNDIEGTKLLKARLELLFQDALILSKNMGFDVFNALTLLDNNLILDDLLFGAGDGFLNYYLFNYRCLPINGGLKNDGYLDMDHRSQLGVVML